MLGTIRFRITALAAVAVLLVLSVAGVAVVVAMRRILTENLEDTIRREANRATLLVERDELTDPIPPAGDDVVLQVVDADGTVLASTANLRIGRAIGTQPASPDESRWQSVDRLPGTHDPFRVVTRRVEGPSGTVVVHAAASLDDVHESTDALTRLLLVAVPLVTILLGALVWWLVGRTLGPVEAIRSEVAAIEPSDLSRRVAEPQGTDEIAELARTMNAMLARVEGAHDRQQRFVADASHELRSPLTRIRSELEVDRDHPETADHVATRDSVLDEIAHLQRLVDDLLLLARSDAGDAVLRREPVDLDDLVLRDVTRLQAESDVSIDARGVSAAQVLGDRDALGRLIRNLTDNAVRHARSAVTLTLAERNGSAQLVVADDGPGIPSVDRGRVFERFTRVDDARAADGGGAGIGLAIVRDIAERHGGRVDVTVAAGGGARFVVELPTGTAAASEAPGVPRSP